MTPILLDNKDLQEFYDEDPELLDNLVETVCQSVSRNSSVLKAADELIEALKPKNAQLVPKESIQLLMDIVHLLEKQLRALWRGDIIESLQPGEKAILKEYLASITPKDPNTEQGYIYRTIPLSEQGSDERVQITIYGKITREKQTLSYPNNSTDTYINYPNHFSLFQRRRSQINKPNHQNPKSEQRCPPHFFSYLLFGKILFAKK